MRTFVLGLAATILALAAPAHASIAYGSLNNFDTVNDCQQECHGFEIEIEDVHSTDITYTYDYNHYGTPKITEDKTDPVHPKVHIRYESGKNPDGSWSAYTAIPSAPIAPTDGHQFVNSSENFGGEHFGVGYYGSPSAVKYKWLVDDGYGNLVDGCPVNIATPVFSYVPPAGGGAAQVQAVIAPPPAPPVREFGPASWVKETRTQTHNNQKVKLEDLVSDDPDNPNDKNWKNGEPDEVEVEWQLLQTEFSQDNGGKNGELAGAPEGLAHGDEVVTRRYDFYDYVGPIDPETGEARVDNVGPDGIHGQGTSVEDGVTTDYSNYIVVGDYLGAQMAGFDAAGQLGLIDHLQDGEIDTPYVDRSMVISGKPPITTTITGALPVGMHFNTTSGVLSGTPTVTGNFSFTLHSTDAAGADETKAYDLKVIVPGAGEGEGEGEGEVGPVTLASTYNNLATLIGATNNDINGDLICDIEQIDCFAAAVDANVDQAVTDTFQANTAQAAAELGPDLLMFLPGLDALVGAWEMMGLDPFIVLLLGDAHDVNSYDLSQNGAVAAILAECNVPSCGGEGEGEGEVPVTYAISTSAAPADGGITSGGGDYLAGDSVTVAAEPNAGYRYLNWSVGDQVVSASAVYTFAANEDTALVANFERITYTVTTNSSPSNGGTTSGGGVVGSGDSVTVVATPGVRFEFTSWNIGAAVVSTSPSYTFTANTDLKLTAKFTRIVYSVATSAAPAEGGVTSGGGSYNSGTKVTALAVPNANYLFKNWTEGGVVKSNSATYAFTLNASRDLVANFVPAYFAINASAAPEEGGTVSGGGSVDNGASVTLVAVPNPGYKFSNWTEDGVVKYSKATYTFFARADRNLVANFAILPTPKVKSITAGTPVVSGATTDAVVTLTSAAPAGGVSLVLSSSKPGVLSVPASLEIAAGEMTGSFTASTVTVTKATNVSVKATLEASSRAVTVQVTP